VALVLVPQWRKSFFHQRQWVLPIPFFFFPCSSFPLFLVLLRTPAHPPTERSTFIPFFIFFSPAILASQLETTLTWVVLSFPQAPKASNDLWPLEFCSQNTFGFLVGVSSHGTTFCLALRIDMVPLSTLLQKFFPSRAPIPLTNRPGRSCFTFVRGETWF